MASPSGPKRVSIVPHCFSVMAQVLLVQRAGSKESVALPPSTAMRSVPPGRGVWALA